VIGKFRLSCSITVISSPKILGTSPRLISSTTRKKCRFSSLAASVHSRLKRPLRGSNTIWPLLRGPLFAISDESLLLFRSATASLPHPLRRLPDDLDAAFAPIREALEYLADLHRARNRRPIAATLNLLLEHVRAHAGFALRQGGERVLANVYRLIDIARRFEVNDATCPRSSRAPLL
jgi:hypothetical protein